jgi:hypothetical protein
MVGGDDDSDDSDDGGDDGDGDTIRRNDLSLTLRECLAS